jgi:hypothetical protein
MYAQGYVQGCPGERPVASCAVVSGLVLKLTIFNPNKLLWTCQDLYMHFISFMSFPALAKLKEIKGFLCTVKKTDNKMS